MENKYRNKKKPEKFWKRMVLKICEGIGCAIFALASWWYLSGNLFPSDMLYDMLKAIPPPPEAELRLSSLRDGRSYYYLIPIEKDEAIIEHYKKELIPKGWQYHGIDPNGRYLFTKPGFGFTVGKELGKSLEEKYNWRMSLFEDP